jgi:ketosteroid isomerase-like protein
MSRENVELVRQCLAARDLGDYRAAQELFHPDLVVDLTARPDGRVYRGREEAAEAMRAWVAVWDDYSYEPQEVIDAGDEVVVFFRETGRGKESGILTEFLGATVWTVEKGRVVRTKTYADRRQALEAVGVRE